MTTNDRMGTRILLSLALLAAVMFAGLFTGTREAGAVTCPSTSTTDTADLDGFPDKCECNEITLGDGQTKINGFGTGTRSQYMDPNSKDLIVWLQRAAGSLLTDTNDVLFQPITNLAAPPGLGVTLHVYGTDIFRPTTDREVMSSRTACTGTTITQKGAWIIEDNISSEGTSGTMIGSTNVVSTPNAAGNASTVYTRRLESFVDGVCAGYSTCIDSVYGFGKDPNNQNTTMTDLYRLYHRQNVNHELAHQMALVPAPAPTKGKGGTSPTVTSAHYPTDPSGSLMEYSVYYKTDSGTNTVTWYIPANFIQYDVNSKRLK